MKHGLFKRIFVLYGAILFLAMFLTEVYVTRTVRTDHINTLRDNLMIQASLIAREISFQSAPPLDGISRRMKTLIHARVTVIAMDGRVIGDSDHESSGMDNHSDRLEVRQAKLSGTGMAIRHSDTLGYDFLYTTMMIMRENRSQGFIRISVPLRDVDASINLLRLRIILVVSIVLLATGLFSLWQIDRLRRLTNQIRDFSRALARGDLGKRLFLSYAGEFDEIAESLNTMSVELKRSLAETEEERNRLTVILSSIPDALLISDVKGIIRIASTASLAFFGDIPLNGKQFIEVIRNREFLSLLDKVQRDHLPGVVDISLNQPEERYCVVRVSPLSYVAGESSGLVAIFHDITQLKKLEQVRKDFVANISHELKTPITAIQGFSETLLEGALDDREHARKFVETIKANSVRINNLVDDLMTISKIELGSIKVNKTAIAFNDTVDTVVSLLRDKAREKNVALTISLPPDLGSIMADQDRLIQILTNLVDNAIKFTPEGGSVQVGLRRTADFDPLISDASDKHSALEIFVEDTGIGILEKHLPRLGERFYRVDSARSRTMGGTGLGLAIVKHLVKAHGWDMRIESAPGKGTRVRIFVLDAGPFSP